MDDNRNGFQREFDGLWDLCALAIRGSAFRHERIPDNIGLVFRLNTSEGLPEFRPGGLNYHQLVSPDCPQRPRLQRPSEISGDGSQGRFLVGDRYGVVGW